jgi:ADP-ribosylglycohydrolase
MTVRVESVVGCLLGAAVGDALGLPYEQLSRRRQRRLFPDLGGHHFLFGRGMVSDDTEHACLTAQALLTSAGDSNHFLRDLARRLRWWFLGLPAGTGKATARACIKLWLGISPRHSGVFSAGNGPSMRSPILGACYGHDPSRLAELVRASTRITHTDPKAEYGALAAAVATSIASSTVPAPELVAEFRKMGKLYFPPGASDLSDLLESALDHVGRGEPSESFADMLGLQRGVTGYTYHTVPVAIHAWLSHPEDFRAAVSTAIRCGGDTDTLAAIVGGIVGARVGKAGIPSEWLAGLWDWPRSVAWIERLGHELAAARRTGMPRPALPLAVWGLPPRNLFFLMVVLAHGFRRILPPY